jgi:conjugal transfer pilus assembly protein TraU
MREFLLCIFLSLCFSPIFAKGLCTGRWVNPITDVCWKCFFPIELGNMKLLDGSPTLLPEVSKKDLPQSALCACPGLPPKVGISFSFWEPLRLVEVVRHPFCFTSLGGLHIDPGLSAQGGAVDAIESGENSSFYHVHYYLYPLLYWMELLETTSGCVSKEALDLAYISEIDPTWKDDELSVILNPEILLYANPIAQVACAADCAKASLGLGLDALYWCSGCQGSLFPLTGHVAAHVNGVQASLLLTNRVLFKMHRIGALRGTMGEKALCNSFYQPIWRKAQYRTQMVYPIPGMSKEPFPCNPIGRSSVPWEMGREFPVNGENFTYLIWRKRSCCLG